MEGTERNETMKLKHWQGYGCVNAQKVSKTKDELVVHVWGMHECGLSRDDAYDIFYWLVRRFDKTRKDYFDIKDYSIDEWYEKDNYSGLDIEHCRYTIRFRT